MMTNLFQTQIHKVIHSKPLSPTVEYLKVEPGLGRDFIPGQFLMVSLPGFGEAPFTPANSPRAKDFIELGIRKTGQLTNKLADLKNGDEIFIRGPYGNGYPIDKIKNKDLLIITGGCGLIPLRSLILHLREKPDYCHKITMLVGAKNPSELIFKNEYPQWEKDIDLRVTVDEPDQKWSGETGVITELVKKLENIDSKNTMVVSCGPMAMGKAISPELLKKDISSHNIYFSIERRMRCGVGLCQHCTCGEKYVCKDGPVFSLNDIQREI